MPASMFDVGSYGLATEYWRAVSGISCIRPIAPLLERARSLYADSTWMTARTSFTGTFCSLANLSMMSAYGTAGAAGGGGAGTGAAASGGSSRAVRGHHRQVRQGTERPGKARARRHPGGVGVQRARAFQQRGDGPNAADARNRPPVLSRQSVRSDVEHRGGHQTPARTARSPADDARDCRL